MYSSFYDDTFMREYSSPSGLTHIASWFGMAVCGVFIDTHNGWRYKGLTSLRRAGRMSRNPQANRLCKRCANNYKDVNVDA
jgi:hypothetical protein